MKRIHHWETNRRKSLQVSLNQTPELCIKTFTVVFITGEHDSKLIIKCTTLVVNFTASTIFYERSKEKNLFKRTLYRWICTR